MEKTLGNKVIGLLFLGAALAVVIVMTPNHYGYSPGDSWMNRLGIGAWSQETVGLHNTFVAGLLIIIPCCWYSIKILRPYFPRFAKWLPYLLLMVAALYPSFQEKALHVLKNHTQGLEAIGYLQQESGTGCGYLMDSRDQSNVKISINCRYALINYSKYPLEVSAVPDFSSNAFYRELQEKGRIEFEPVATVLPPHSKASLVFTTKEGQLDSPLIVQGRSNGSNTGVELEWQGTRKSFVNKEIFS